MWFWTLQEHSPSFTHKHYKSEHPLIVDTTSLQVLQIWNELEVTSGKSTPDSKGLQQIPIPLLTKAKP